MTKRYFDVVKDGIDVTVSRGHKKPSLVITVGRRGAGKTHSCLKEALIHAIREQGLFVYVRRVTTEITSRNLNKVFTNVIRDPDVLEVIKGSDWAGYDRYIIAAKSETFYLCGIGSDNSMVWLTEVGTATCISMAEHFKGGTYPDYDRVIFDEFISEHHYIYGDKEPDEFQKITGTVGRKPADGSYSKEVITYLCGNPDNSIEACPYLYALHLDYAQMQPNQPYYYERKNGEATIFIKVTMYGVAKDVDYIDPSVSSLFDTQEDYMAETGEMKENSYIMLTEEVMERFTPAYVLEVETPILAKDQYHKVIYAAYGLLKYIGYFPEYVLIITGHDDFKGCQDRIYCRYDRDRFGPRKIPQTWRLNIPQEEKFADLMRIMAHIDSSGLVFTTANRYATLYDSIRESTKA